MRAVTKKPVILPPDAMTVEQTAEHLGISTQTLANLEKRRNSPQAIRATGRVYYSRSVVDRWRRLSGWKPGKPVGRVA